MNVPNSERSDVEAALLRHNTERQLRKWFWDTSRLHCCDFGTHRNTCWGDWNRNSLSLKRKLKVRSTQIFFCSEKGHKVMRTRRQLSCHGNEVRFHPHTVFSVNQAWDAPQHLFVRVSWWEVSVALSAIVTSLWDKRDILPSAGLRDLSEEKWLSCFIFALWWLMRICRSLM